MARSRLVKLLRAAHCGRLRHHFPARAVVAVLAVAITAVAVVASGVAAQVATPATPVATLAGEARLLRFPHIHGEKVVFTYAGDLYTVPVTGGRATRLTSHEGLEVFARFSPDGRWIAFSGEYAGTRQVYLIPAEGGEPRQLTFYPDVGPMPPRGGYDHLPLDWTPDGKKILVRAHRTPFSDRVGRYFLVDPWNGGLETPLEIPEGGSGATFDATGTKLAYNIKMREWRNWKRYQGGRQQDVWVYDLVGHTSERLTDHPGTDNFPMWVGDVIYYVSDREDGKLNLWAYDPRTGEHERVTAHAEYDVLWPSRGGGRDRLRERRLPLPPRPGDAAGAADRGDDPGRPAAHDAAVEGRAQEHRDGVDLAQREAGAVHGAR